jgi:hypothetical protein
MKDKNSASYMAMTSSGAVERIRTPLASDILLGRGGSINSHEGNQVFREWVKARREEYNLAPNKAEKTRIARKVMDLVFNSGGRFLQKDPTTSAHCWVEVDDLRALAKTSQALREGAPQIRASHQPEDPGPPSRKRRVAQASGQLLKRTRVETPPPSPEGPAQAGQAVSPDPYRSAIDELKEGFQQAKGEYRPLMSNAEFQEHKSRETTPDNFTPCTLSHHHGHEQKVYLDEIPNLLTSIPHMPHELPPSHIRQKRTTPPPIPLQQPMQRFNSLALSDISANYWTNSGDWGSSGALNELEFVNPFLDDESDAFLVAERDSRSQTTIVRNVSSERAPRGDDDQLNTLHGWSSGDNINTEYHPETLHDQGDFNEEVMQIMDQAASTGKEMPTLLLPFRGGALQQRYGSQSTYMSSQRNSSGTSHRSVSPH